MMAAKVIALVLGFVLFAPVILWIAVTEWWRQWRSGPAPTPFIPERTTPRHRFSCREGVAPCGTEYCWYDTPFQEWAADMERGRQTQEKEEGA